MSIIFTLLLLPLLLLFTFGIPILIAVFVYRDAKKRQDCDPVLWALVAALVPSLIGLVIYLLVRSDFPLKDDASRMAGYRSYNDGSSYYNADYEAGAAPKKFPTWAKILIIVVAVLILLLLVMSLVPLFRHIFEYVTYGSGFYL